MFKATRPDGLLPAEIAFRLCALRETFEECGVLIVRKTKPEERLQTGPELVTAETSRSLNLTDWRRRVNKDARQFLELCRELKMVPDIWALYEWCNWLTPVMGAVTEPPPKPRRFDTIFYVCCLDGIPEARVDKRETTVAQWENPGALLAQYQAGNASMVGPQLLELSKLCNFTRIDNLAQFSLTRESRGLERWLPVPVFASDGMMTVLPGDDLYPSDPDFNGTRKPFVSCDKETLEELHNKARKMNRMPREGMEGRGFLMNIVPPLGYAPPHPSILTNKDIAANL
jgi:nucleoside diphosphate-linked moiety X motif protein 19